MIVYTFTLINRHFVGSFGHFQARSFGLSTGGREADWALGLCKTRASVLKLNNIILQSQTKEGLPTTSVTMFPVSSTSEKSLIDIGALSHIDSLLSNGIWPLLHGNVLLDTNRCSVYSGDKIMLWLARSLRGKNKPQIAVFLTDVSGVYDKPPSSKDAKLISEIEVQHDGTVKFPEMSVADHDVTGE